MRTGSQKIITLGLVLTLLLIPNARPLTAQQIRQNAYASAQEAVFAFLAAVKNNETQQLMEILGNGGKDIIDSGDPVADRQSRQQFLDKYSQMHRIVMEPNGLVTLYIGAENWPFPIPLVVKDGFWRFDTAAGRKEVLLRRIGRDEFDTIDTLDALVDAQREYASKKWDENTDKQYAQKLMSDEGRHNGLYWDSTEGGPQSPIGPLIAEAGGEGYRTGHGAPFHGYIYRFLQKQGPNAPGGAADYSANGKQTRGFAIVAYPAEYRNSGVMTFIVNKNGKVYQKDLGPETARIASSMTQYNPDQTWQLAEEAR